MDVSETMIYTDLMENMDSIDALRLLAFGFVAGVALIVGGWWYTFRLAEDRRVPYPWWLATISALLGTPFIGWAVIMVFLWAQPVRHDSTAAGPQPP